MNDLFTLGLREAVNGIRAGTFTSEALTRACLARTQSLEDKIGAWQWLDPEAALAKARLADAALRSGQQPSALYGMPVGIKDIMLTCGIPTEMGSSAFAGHVPDYSATVVERLQAAGAFVMGKTVTAELAYFTPGKTRNPWHPAHTPGGSSSGSAAAVAAGFVPAALGTQTNGSVIRPAAFCGIVGFKPSAGLLSRAGIQPFSPTLDQVGVFTRSVDDAALLSSCLLGRDPKDKASLATDVLAQQHEIAALDRPPKLAAVRSPVWHLAEGVQQQCFLGNIAALRKAGAMVEEIELDTLFSYAHDTQKIIMYAEAARELAGLQHQHRDKLSARLSGLIDEGLGIKEQAYQDALALRIQLGVRLNAVFDDFDAIITPPATGEAPATLAHTGDPAFCTIWTLCGVPALTIPSGLGPNGLPLGLQLVGKFLQDDVLLQVAKWCVAEIKFSASLPE